jgi:2-methylcitrate dehydratase PrpD
MNDAGSTEAGPIQARLAEFVAGTRYADLPPVFIERLKWSLLDSLGCGLYGGATPWGRIVADFARSQGEGPCQIWGAGHAGGVSATSAVLANATAVQSFEIDDVHYASRSHPGSITVPVAMALVESGAKVSGKALIEALAVGYELQARVGVCQGVSSFNRGWHPTGTAGVFAAAATASRLLGLDAATTSHALGVAGTMPAGLMAAQYGAMVKRLFVGHTAWAGLSGALLAQRGFTGIPTIFEAEYGGYLRAVSDEIDLDALHVELGSRFDGAAVGYKLFACVGTNHTTLEALSTLIRNHDVDWRDVEAIDVVTSEYQVLHSGWPYQPDSVMTAQMNMRYCAAVLLMQGQVFIDQFDERYLADAAILELAGRVNVTANPAQDHKDRTAVVTIRTKQGVRLEASCRASRGHPDSPPTTADIEGKFRALAGKILPAESCARIVEIVAGIERLDDVSGLAPLLVA